MGRQGWLESCTESFAHFRNILQSCAIALLEFYIYGSLFRWNACLTLSEISIQSQKTCIVTQPSSSPGYDSGVSDDKDHDYARQGIENIRIGAFQRHLSIKNISNVPCEGSKIDWSCCPWQYGNCRRQGKGQERHACSNIDTNDFISNLASD